MATTRSGSHGTPAIWPPHPPSTPCVFRPSWESDGWFIAGVLQALGVESIRGRLSPWSKVLVVLLVNAWWASVLRRTWAGHGSKTLGPGAEEGTTHVKTHCKTP